MASLSNINGIFDVHSTGAILFSNTHGTSGQILRSNGNAAPTWVDASTVIGGPYLPLTGGTLTGPLSGTSATFSGVVNTTSGYEKNGYNVIGQNGTTLRINNAAYWQQLELFTNGTPRLTIQANGNAGIGTSTPTNGKLVIASTQNNSNDYTWLLFDNKASGYGDWSVYKSGNNDLSFGYGTSNGASYTNALTLEYGGNVGIGTESPDTKLHVHNTTNSQLTIERTGTAPGKYGFYTNTGNLFINNVTGGASTIPMIILNNGNVGIGSGNPSSKLAIDGGFNYPTVRWFSSNNTSRYMQVGMITPTEHSIRAYGSSSELTFWTASSFSMVIDGGGNVGIGTTSPTEKLHVEGNIEFINGGWIGSLDGSYWQRIRFEDATPTTTNAFNFETRNGSGAFVNHMTILNNGNVGIGTTLPGFRLEVVSPTTNVVSRFTSQDNQGWISVRDDGYTTYGAMLGCDHDAGLEVILANNAATKRLVIKDGGNVGIGTDSPAASAKLTVMGNQTFGLPANGTLSQARFISIEGNTDSSGEGSSRIFFSEHNSTTAAMDNYGMSLGYRGGATSIVGASGNTWTGLTQIGNGQWGMWGHNNNATGSLVMFGDRAATYVSIPPKVGINNTNPNAYLRVDGTTTVTAARFYGTGGTRPPLELRQNNTAGWFAKFYSDNFGTYIGGISFYGSSTTFNTSSDYRLKENIIPISDSITRLKQLKPSRFNFKQYPEITIDGFLAHEVQDIVPEAVTGDKDELDLNGKPVYQAIDHSRLIPLLVAAIQELEARVKELENK